MLQCYQSRSKGREHEHPQGCLGVGWILGNVAMALSTNFHRDYTDACRGTQGTGNSRNLVMVRFYDSCPMPRKMLAWVGGADSQARHCIGNTGNRATAGLG